MFSPAIAQVEAGCINRPLRLTLIDRQDHMQGDGPSAMKKASVVQQCKYE